MTFEGTGTDAMAIACDLTGVTEAQRARHREMAAALAASRTGVQRGGERRVVTFGPEASLPLIAQFLDFERRCCAFLEFDLVRVPS